MQRVAPLTTATWDSASHSGKCAQPVRFWSCHKQKSYLITKPVCRRCKRGIPKDKLRSEKAVWIDFRTGVRLPSGPPEKSTHLSIKTMCAFFNEICPAGKWNSFAVKYLLRKCEIFADANVGKFHFTLRRRSNISQFTKWIISHSAGAEYFTFSKPVDRFEPPRLKCLQSCGIMKTKVTFWLLIHSRRI